MNSRLGQPLSAPKRVRFGLWYSLRNPGRWHQPSTQLYSEMLDQIRWAGQIGSALPLLVEPVAAHAERPTP